MMSPAQKRALAVAERSAARDVRRTAYERQRQADQLEHEAQLEDEADAASAALEAVRDRLPGLAAAEEEAAGKVRAADLRFQEDQAAADRYAAEEAELGEANAPAGEQADAAKAASKAARVAAGSKAALDQARTDHERARQNILALNAEIRACQADYAAAVRRALFPGQAPRTSPLALGAATAADMTDEERQLIGSIALLAALGSDRPQPSRPSPGETLQDVTRWRRIRGANSMLVIPPAASGGRP